MAAPWHYGNELEDLPRTGIQFVNEINRIGCNIVSLHGVGYKVQTIKLRKNLSNEEVIQLLKEDLEQVIEEDRDYAQLCLIQIMNIHASLQDAIRKILPIRFESTIRGGHGNGPLTLFGIDLALMRGRIREDKALKDFIKRTHPEKKIKRKYVKSGKYAKVKNPEIEAFAQEYLNAA